MDTLFYNLYLSQQDMYKLQSNIPVVIFADDGTEIKIQTEWNSATSSAEKESI